MQAPIFKSVLFIISTLILIHLSSCKKNIITNDTSAVLAFSTDTIQFDTVFTAMGSSTQELKIYNRNNQAVVISRVALAGGSASDFKINVDGESTTLTEDIELAAGDSIYLFASVIIDPNDGDAIREDSLLFSINGNEQKVLLSAYGWNAHYHSCRGCNEIYTNANFEFANDGKPHIIMGYMTFDSNSLVTIPAGVEHIYMYGGPSTQWYQRGRIVVDNGSSLKVNVGGDLNNPVEFKTHRLEEDYQELPMNHGGIYLGVNSVDNQIHGAIIRNAVEAISVVYPSINGNPKLELKNTMIYNVSNAGIVSIKGDIEAENLIVASSSNYNIAIREGGNYLFNHCSFINYAENFLVSRNEPILSIADFYVYYDADGNRIFQEGEANILFNNCVITGTKTEEIELSRLDGEGQPFNLNFDGCLVKRDTFNVGLAGQNILNEDPLFNDVANYDYSIDTTTSPLIDNGTVPTNVTTDIMGRSRPQGNGADIGAFEYIP
ncbi:MAG: hypothetical protein MK212_04025 [Saprospiraceae bacterium]|nr:hypothetical protein [Saprospiraceae bacterium]